MGGKDRPAIDSRTRSTEESPIFMGHMLVVEGSQPIVQHEADRNRFIGRNQSSSNPIILSSQDRLSGTSGATLDPIFALGFELNLNPHTGANLAYLTFAAESREAILSMAVRYNNWILIQHSFQQADIAAQTWLGKQKIPTEVLKNFLQVLSALIYSFKIVRTTPETIAANKLGRQVCGVLEFRVTIPS